MDRLTAEYRILSFAAEKHPFALVRDRLPRGTVSSERFVSLPNRSEVRVAGIVVARQRPQTAKGYIFILMEDEAGPINAIVRPDVYDACKAAIRLEPFLSIEGILQKDGATYNVLASSVLALRLERSDLPPRPSPDGPEIDEFSYLEAIRGDPPPAMSWGGGSGCR